MRIECTNDAIEARDAMRRGSSFTDVNRADARFAQFNLSRAHFGDGSMPGAGFDNVSLAGSTIRNANPAGPGIAACDLDRMRIEGVLVTDLLATWKERA